MPLYCLYANRSKRLPFVDKRLHILHKVCPALLSVIVKKELNVISCEICQHTLNFHKAAMRTFIPGRELLFNEQAPPSKSRYNPVRQYNSNFFYLLLHLLNTILSITLMYIRVKMRMTSQFHQMYGRYHDTKAVVYVVVSIRLYKDQNRYRELHMDDCNSPPKLFMTLKLQYSWTLVWIKGGGINCTWIFPSHWKGVPQKFTTTRQMEYCLYSGKTTRWNL